jgi:surface polysaccharide O-acyltransferase-like enzyme
MIVKGLAPPGLQIVADLGFVLSSATSCLALMAVFLRFAATPQPVLGALSEHAYGIYFVHYLFVVWLQYIMLTVALFAIAKAAIVFVGALFLSWSAAALVARVPLGARVLGGKRRGSVERAPAGNVTAAQSPSIADRAGAM